VLRLSFVLHSIYESGSLLRSLVGSCPRLERLDLACGRMPSFTLVSRSFSAVLRVMNQLLTCVLVL